MKGEVPLRWRGALALLRLVPQAAISRLVGRLAEVRLPGPLRGPVNRTFARAVGADLTECLGTPADHRSLSDFFVRELRPGVRAWPASPDLPGSPVDGTLGAFGAFHEGTVLQAKGRPYSIRELLGGGEAEARAFSGGVYLTLYLSPRHYHRIHAPVRGGISQARALPGRLLPVNLPAVRHVPDLFPRNERLVARLEGNVVRAAVVAVGAFNVGRIHASFDPPWNGPCGRGVTNRGPGRSPESRDYRPPLAVEQGEEIMRFHLGSTVVLLLTPRAAAREEEGRTRRGEGGPEGLQPHPDLREGDEVRLGTPLVALPGNHV